MFFSLAFFEQLIGIRKQKVFLIEGLLSPLTFYSTLMWMRLVYKRTSKNPCDAR